MSEIETKIESDSSSMELYSNDYPFRLPMKTVNFENEVDFDKFVKNCERLIRSSYEYKQWRNYITDVLGANICVITNESMTEVSLDVHHHLPSLFIVTKSVINKKMTDHLSFSTFDICSDVLELHFLNRIGYCVLLKSIHEKFHNGFLTVPIEYVKGNYLLYLQEYTKYLDEEDLEKINNRLIIHESNCSWTKDNYQNNDSSHINTSNSDINITENLKSMISG